MSLLLFYQFLTRENLPVWIIETEYIHLFSSLYFILFPCPWGKTNNLFLFSKVSLIALEMERNYMKTDFSVIAGPSFDFPLWGSHKSLTSCELSPLDNKIHRHLKVLVLNSMTYLQNTI